MVSKLSFGLILQIYLSGAMGLMAFAAGMAFDLLAAAQFSTATL